ncbi:MAG: VanZ family protein [Candidatus Moraniibacteriota bacterium]
MFQRPFSKKYLFGSLLISWMIVIFALSSIPGVVSPYESPLWYVLERKGAHVIEFLVLALLTATYFSTHTTLRKGKKSLYVLVFLFCMVYALSDEIHQFFVFGRQARFTDVLIDSGGAILGVISFFFWQQKKMRARLLKAYRSLKRKTSL